MVSISVRRCADARATCARADSVVSFFVDVTIARERKDWLGAKLNEFKTTAGALTVSWANLAQNVLVKFVCESDRAKN